jgi:hypothetical protein
MRDLARPDRQPNKADSLAGWMGQPGEVYSVPKPLGQAQGIMYKVVPYFACIVAMVHELAPAERLTAQSESSTADTLIYKLGHILAAKKA